MAANTDKAWRSYGRVDPFFGVLANSRFRRAEMNADRRAEFYATGDQEVAETIEQLDRFAPDRKCETVVDFGCGVGRCLMALARHYHAAVGIDVSEGMIAEARKAADERNLDNVHFIGTLDALDPSVDLLHSVYVLQHIEPRRGRILIVRMWERLAPGGILALQFPIRSRRPLASKMKEGFKTQLPGLVRTTNLLRKGHADPPMHMYCYDLGAVVAGLYASAPAEIQLIRRDPDEQYFGVFLFARKRSNG